MEKHTTGFIPILSNPDSDKIASLQSDIERWKEEYVQLQKENEKVKGAFEEALRILELNRGGHIAIRLRNKAGLTNEG